MTTSGNTFPTRLRRIDQLSRPLHYYLTDDDNCLYLWEYTARQDYLYSDTNNLISNFKKDIAYKDNPPVWRHKEMAIQTVAEEFRIALGESALDHFTFVPVPPSKAQDHPEYDDRMLRMLQAMRKEPL